MESSMKTLRKAFILIVISIFLSIGIFTETPGSKNTSQGDAEIRLRFVQDQLVTRYIPFNQIFEIYGDTKKSEDFDATHVQIKIRLTNVFSTDPDPKTDEQDLIWTRKDKTQTEFSIFVSPLTLWKHAYHLQFTFLEKIEPGIVERLLSEYEDYLNDLFKSNGGYEINDIKKEMASMFKAKIIGDSNIYKKNASGEFKKIEPVNQAEMIINIINQSGLELSLSRIRNIEKDISTSLINFNTAKNSPSINGGAKIGTDDAELVKKLLEKKDPITSETIKKIVDQNRGIISGLQINKLHLLTQNALDLIEKMNKLEGIKDSWNFTKQKFNDEVTRLCIEELVYHFSKSTFPVSASEFERIMVGTIFGFGYAPLSLFKNPEWVGFSYVGVKLYFGPVDRSLPEPFLTPSSHWSFLVCAVLKSSLTYRGQLQDDFPGGIKPMLGIGYDFYTPILKSISVNLGVILFSQPDVNPLAEPDPKPKASVFLGISFDLDLINKLVAMLKP
jgi:hypothetical protein